MKTRILLIAAMAFSGIGNAATVVLSPGVLVDVDNDEAFAVDPTGFTQRIQLSDGAAVWVSPEKVYPLALADGALITLAAPESPGSANIVLLNPATGEVIDRVSFDLPETVSATYFPKPKRRFQASVLDTPEGARIFWRHEYQTLRGAAMLELDQDGNETINPITVDTGAFDLARDQNRYYAIPVRTAFAEPVAPTVALKDDERVAGVAGMQFRAADNRHVQTSAAQPHPSFGQIFQWSVYDREGQRKGGFTSPYARAPFVVSDEALIIRDQPFGFLDGGRWVERGTRLVGIDLGSGDERWSFAVLDHEYRGPLPP